MPGAKPRAIDLMNPPPHFPPRRITATRVRWTPALTAPRARAPRSLRPLLSSRAIWRGFKRLTQFGWPRRFVIVQFPNAPLVIAFLAGELAKHTHGSAHAYASSVSYLALVIWAYLELVEGVNWFRRLLGLTYVISTAVHLALALQS
jgi:hypothetical protein